MAGQHRTDRAMSPAAMAQVAGIVLVANAIVFAVSSLVGWWDAGLALAVILLLAGAAAFGWGRGFEARDRDGPP